MGTEYYVISTQTRTFYDLGKGSWYELNRDKEAFQDQEYLTLYILEDVYDKEYFEKFHPNLDAWKDIVEHVTTRVAPDLFKAFGCCDPNSIHVFDDCGDDITICKAKGYRCVGMRYYEIGDKNWCEGMDRMNRHLSDDPMNKRWWNPDLYTKYKELEKY